MRITKVARNTLRFALAVAAGTVCLFINDNMSTSQRSSLITQADARMSVPGERRRFACRGPSAATRLVITVATPATTKDKEANEGGSTPGLNG